MSRPVTPIRPDPDEGEKISEYFDFVNFPEKAERKVKRNELAAILSTYHAAGRQGPLTRAWRWFQRYLAQSAQAPYKAVE